jgi:D-amino-acid oxidase
VDDEQLAPLRGQLIVCEPVCGVNEFVTVEDDDGPELSYVIPRSDVLVLGGTAQSGDYSTVVDSDQARGIRARCEEIVPRLRGAIDPVREHRCGLRPARPLVRVEHDRSLSTPRTTVIHNYGA